MSHLPAWQTRLYKRGILSAALGAGLQPDGDGWRYPIADLTGKALTHRWKAYNSAAFPKYLWQPDKPDGCDYYYPTNINLHRAIADADGVLYIAAGEVDLLTFVSAGLDNVLSWFGENAVPKTLAADLTALGVCRVVYLPDKDKVGRESAATVGQYLADSGITYEPRQLPDELPTKGDTNDLWQRVRFDPAAFRAAIDSAPPLELPTPEPPPDTLHEPFRAAYTAENDQDYTAAKQAAIDAIKRVLGATKIRRAGFSNMVKCPHHDDHIKSATVHMESGVLKCYVCTPQKGEGLSPKVTAERLGIPYPQRQRRPKRSVQARERERAELETVGEITTPKTDDNIIHFNAPYVTGVDLPISGALAIISDTGTGKSERAYTCIQAVKRQDAGNGVCVVSPLISLTRAAAERYRLPNYLDIRKADRPTSTDIAITLPSLDGFATLDSDHFPKYKVLVLDEFSGIVKALRSRKLFKKGKSTRVFSVLKRLIQNTETVLILDKDLTDTHLRWLREIRPDLKIARNQYHRPCGQLDILADSAALDTLMLNTVAENKGVVFAVSASKPQIERWQEALTDLYGEGAILAVHSGNSTDPAQRRFLTNPNTEIKQYRAVLCSPSVMTGLDIQTPVYRTFGSFRSDPLDAPACLQMLARARHTGHTSVWLEASTRNLPTRPKTIYQRARYAAHRTGRLCAINDQGALDFDGIQKELLTLQSEDSADTNRSLNNLYADFLERAKANYTVNIITDDLPTDGASAIWDADEKVKQRHKDLALTVDPISPDEHRRRSFKGIRTVQDNAGLTRWLIEDTYKQPITDELYDDYQDKGRDKLLLYMDVFHTAEADLKALDNQELADDEAYLLRRHFAMRQRTIRRLLLALFGKRENIHPDTVLSAADIAERVGEFVGHIHGKDVQVYLAQRPDYSTAPLKMVQRVLRMMGLKLVQHRTDRASRKKDAPKFYKLCPIASEFMEGLASVRSEALENEAVLAEAATWDVTKIRSKDIPTAREVITTKATHAKLVQWDRVTRQASADDSPPIPPAIMKENLALLEMLR